MLEYQLPTTQAAEVLGISERQVRRVLAAYRREGAAALVHGNRGRQPRNAVNEDVATAVVILASGKYAGFNHSHMSEVLAEREGIHLSRQTVSRLLNRHGLPSARRHRPPKHRVRRERMPQEGMLLQIDGSHHPWLEERGPRFALLLAVDDATGTVAGAVFQPEEDTRGYFLLMEGIIRRYGIPLALYGDRHGVFKFSGKPRHIQPPVEATHFSRAMQELGIEQVFARSPQAKGRVERMAGTFQDRLVSELRLVGATTIDQANAVLREFLPQFNKQFRVPAQLAQVAYRPLDSSIFLERVLCFKHTRQVAMDNTVKFQWRTLQLLPSQDRPSYAGAKVEVLEQSGGQLMVRYDGEVIPHQEAPPRPGALRASNGALAPTPEMAQVVRTWPSTASADCSYSAWPPWRQPSPPASGVRRTPQARYCAAQGGFPAQQALWKAVHHARLQGVSLRGIAKQLGISRNTVRKYVDLPAPPVNRTRRRAAYLAIQDKTNGHFP